MVAITVFPLPEAVKQEFYETILPRLRLSPGYLALSHGDGLDFYAHCVRYRPGIDVEQPFAGRHAAAVRIFFSRIRPGCRRIQSLSQSQLGRAWAICESLLKYAGTGWNKDAGKKLKAAAFWEREGKAVWGASAVFWRTWALYGHWLCLAADEWPELKIAPLSQCQDADFSYR